MELKEIIQLFEAAGYEPRSYSGRGMFGQKCLGVSCDSEVRLIIDFVRELCATTDDQAEINDVLDMISDVKTDSLGRQTIIYWPDIEWKLKTPEEDE